MLAQSASSARWLATHYVATGNSPSQDNRSDSGWCAAEATERVRRIIELVHLSRRSLCCATLPVPRTIDEMVAALAPTFPAALSEQDHRDLSVALASWMRGRGYFDAGFVTEAEAHAFTAILDRFRGRTAE